MTFFRINFPIHYALFIMIMNLYKVVLRHSWGRYEKNIVTDKLIVNYHTRLSTITYSFINQSLLLDTNNN